MSYSHIKVSGNNNSVVFDGCCGIVSLIVRGNDCQVKIGKDTTIENAYMVCMGNNNTILIGEDCMFSSNVEVWNSDTHLITDLEGTPINHKPAPVTIGNHVWLGKHAKVLKNVSIGDNTVIGMCSVVTKAVPRNSIAAGNPAKVIRDNIKWGKKYITRWFGDNLK